MNFLTVLSLCLHVMTAIQPRIDHVQLAVITTVGFLQADKPTQDETHNLALTLANELEESSFQVNAIGDSGKSCGPMQIYGGCRLSPVENVIEGIRQIKISFAVCPKHPFAAYVGGPKGCENERLQKVDAHRMRNVHWIEGMLNHG